MNFKNDGNIRRKAYPIVSFKSMKKSKAIVEATDTSMYQYQ